MSEPKLEVADYVVAAIAALVIILIGLCLFWLFDPSTAMNVRLGSAWDAKRMIYEVKYTRSIAPVTVEYYCRLHAYEVAAYKTGDLIQIEQGRCGETVTELLREEFK